MHKLDDNKVLKHILELNSDSAVLVEGEEEIGKRNVYEPQKKKSIMMISLNVKILFLN